MYKKTLSSYVMALCATPLIAFSANTIAKNTTINVGWETPADSSLGILAVKFKEYVEEYSNGTVNVKLRCCKQIGDEETAIGAMQLGTVDAFLVSQNNMSRYFPLMDVFVLPYIFQSENHIDKVLNGSIGEELRKQIYEKAGIHLISYGGVFFREIFTVNTPVDSIEDMKGLKFRVPQNRVMIDTAAAFGAHPVALAWSEVPTALQTGAIDASDNGLSTIRDMKFYEFAKHLVRVEAIAAFVPLFMSDRVMKKLDDKQKEAVYRAGKDASDYQADYIRREQNDIRKWLGGEGGMTLHNPDKAPFMKAAMKVQDKFAEAAGDDAENLLTAIRDAALVNTDDSVTVSKTGG